MGSAAGPGPSLLSGSAGVSLRMGVLVPHPHTCGKAVHLTLCSQWGCYTEKPGAGGGLW